MKREKYNRFAEHLASEIPILTQRDQTAFASKAGSGFENACHRKFRFFLIPLQCAPTIPALSLTC